MLCVVSITSYLSVSLRRQEPGGHHTYSNKLVLTIKKDLIFIEFYQHKCSTNCHLVYPTPRHTRALNKFAKHDGTSIGSSGPILKYNRFYFLRRDIDSKIHPGHLVLHFFYLLVCDMDRP